MTTVWSTIQEKLDDGPLHFTLLDPATSPGEDGAGIAARVEEFGTDAILVGGSTGVTSQNLDALVRGIQSTTDLPVVHFPGSAGAISPSVDAILFMSTLNSRNVRYVVGEQLEGAPVVRELGIEPIGMGYVIVDPGMTVGEVSEANLVPRDGEGARQAASYALVAEYFGMELLYLEAGSGAPAPVPPELVRAAREASSIPLVVGGGIRSGEDAGRLVKAGADVVVTGTIAENGDYEVLEDVVHTVKGSP